MRPERFELPTLWFVAKCSIQLSYGRATRYSQQISIIAETSRLMKTKPLPGIRIQQTPYGGTKYFLSRDLNKPLA